MKTLTLHHDSDIQNPSEFDGSWTLYSFSRRHASYRDPSEFFPNGRPSIGLRRKLEVGTAFVLSYFEHSGCKWSLRGKGPKCQFDSVDVAGILIWENSVKDMGAKTKEQRAQDAEYFLTIYTDWCNGNGYGYDVTDEKGELLDSCFGFYGSEIAHMAEQVREVVGKDVLVEVKGEARDLAGHYNFGQPA